RIVAIFQRFVTHGDKLAFSTRGTTRFRKPFNGRRPENIVFTPAGTFYVCLMFLVGRDWQALGKSLVIPDGCKLILPPDFRILCHKQQVLKQFVLYLIWVF